MVLLTSPSSWYGNDPGWYVPFDTAARAALGKHLTISAEFKLRAHGDPAALRMKCGGVVPNGRIPSSYGEEPFRIYRHDGIDVQGRIARVSVTVVFAPIRWYPGDSRPLDGREFPAVYADRMIDSPHRFADGALCLYHPHDPVQRRWTPEKGLTALLSLAADHLFFEDVYRESDPPRWIAPEAEHGFRRERRRVA
jgi:hypothetical protein